MSIQDIKADNYREALDRINAIFDAAPGTVEYEELDRLATLVNDYEDELYSSKVPTTSEVDTRRALRR